MGKKRKKKSKAQPKETVRTVVEYRRFETHSNYRAIATDQGSADAVLNPALRLLRARSRQLAENNDLYAGLLNELVSKVVGDRLDLEPMGVSNSGRRLKRFNEQALRVWEDFIEYPESTGQLQWGEVCRRLAYMSFQDGELFLHHVNTDFPFSPGQLRYVFQILEADYCPVDFVPAQGEFSTNWVQGIRHDDWGRPQIYYFHREHPGNTIHPFSSLYKLDPYQAEVITHYKHVKRWPQTRGQPLATPALNRMRDIHDYELDEMLTAKSNARNALVVKKDPGYDPPPDSGLLGHGDPDHPDHDDNEQPVRDTPPVAVYELLPGEDAHSFITGRPNPELTAFRAAMLRGVCSAVGVMYSNVARQYDSSYSASRQELVEGVALYNILLNHYCDHCLKPIYMRVIRQGILERRIELPATTTLERACRFMVTPVGTPWIDPLKEAQADKLLLETDLASREQILRKRGVNPRQLKMQLELEAEDQPEEPTPTIEQPQSAPSLAVVEDEETEDEAA